MNTKTAARIRLGINAAKFVENEPSYSTNMTLMRLGVQTLGFHAARRSFERYLQKRGKRL